MLRRLGLRGHRVYDSAGSTSDEPSIEQSLSLEDGTLDRSQARLSAPYSLQTSHHVHQTSTLRGSGQALFHNPSNANPTFAASDHVTATKVDGLDPLGLWLVHDVPNPSGDIIFVHGLGGTAKRTWSWERDVNNFWPVWLTEEDALASYRIFTFGYNSNFKGAGTNLNITDFAKDLLFHMLVAANGEDCVPIGRQPIIFVAHSMGGLVVKKSYVLGKHDDQYANIIAQVYGIVFLATPHRGTHYAKILNNILWTAPFGAPPKAYIEDLDTQSGALQDINEQFRVLCGELSLVSFFETLKTSFGVKKAMIVEKESGVLGYPQETSTPLNADHHTICKFKSRNDGNYISVKNMLRLWASKLAHPEHPGTSRSNLHPHGSSGDFDLAKRIQGITGIREQDISELKSLRSKAVSGTCRWLVCKENFSTWLKARPTSHSPSIFLLIGLPAMGKSVLASYVAHYLLSQADADYYCQYHFFSTNHQSQRTSAFCLRSIISQLALSDEDFRQRLFALNEESGINLGSQNQSFSVMWETVFEGVIFKMRTRPLYWILDALDESDVPSTLLNSLLKIKSRTPIKIFITSRPIRIPSGTVTNGSIIDTHFLSEIDTSADIQAYVRSVVDEILPDDGAHGKENIIGQVLSKAGGSFLWVRLALETLRDNWHTQEDIRRVLTDLPLGMEQLYLQMLVKVEDQAPRVQLMAKRILTWTTCCWRPLKVIELEIALEPEFSGFYQFEETIVQVCGNFVTVDNGKVHLIHMTARQFLLSDHDGRSAFIDPGQGHELVASKCLQYLSDDKWKRIFKTMKATFINARSSTCPRNSIFLAEEGNTLLGYSVCYFAYHVSKSPLDSLQLPTNLNNFLSHYSLTWIEAFALSRNLGYLIRSAKYLKTYANRRSRRARYIDIQNNLAHKARQSDDAEGIQRWAIDFIRIAGKFGPNIIQSPSSVYRLIPPYCPRTSMIGSMFGSQPRMITVTGLISERWDDRLASVHVGMDELSKVLATESHFITLSSQSGRILVWHAETCEEARRMHHGEYTTFMVLDRSQKVLATAGDETYRVWEISSGKELHRLSKTSYALTMCIAFGNDASKLVVALDDCSVTCFDLELSQQEWHSTMPMIDDYFGGPLVMNISPDSQKLAMAWRGKVPVVWDFTRTQSLSPVKCRVPDSGGSLYSPITMQWQRDSNSVLILCQDTNVIEWYIFDEEQQEFPHLKPHDMTISQDGKFLITSDNQGTISVFLFPRLSLIYQLVNEIELIEGLAFSPDGQRFYDIRGPICNVWEPDALVRADDYEFEDQGISIATEPVIAQDESSQIHVMSLAVSAADVFYCAGREDGTVCIHDAAEGKRVRKVSAHSAHSSILRLAWSHADRYIVSSDDSGRILAKRLELKDTNTFAVFPVFDTRVDEPVEQFLFDDSEELLLISTASSDRVWNLKRKKELCYQHWSSTKGRRWIQHPFSRELLIWVDPSAVHTYRWTDLKHADLESALPKSPAITNSTSSHGKAVLWAALTSNKQYIVYLSAAGHVDSRLANGLYLKFLSTIDLKNVLPQSWISNCVTEIAPLIRRLIGTYQDRIVFIDHDYWLCTWRIDAGLDEFKRHFFLPKDWLNHNTLHMATLNAQGTFFCPKHGKVAVVKHGMRF